MIYKYDHYVDFLNHWIESSARGGFGVKKQMASFLEVQTSYISQVLSKRVVIKEEHAIKVTEFVRMDAIEADYFMTLVAVARADTKELKDHYSRRLKRLQGELKQSVRKNEPGTLVIQDEIAFERYYSSWIYAAIHLLASTRPVSAKVLWDEFRLPESDAKSVLGYLHEVNLLSRRGDVYRHSGERIHLPKDHKWVNHQHLNSRIKTLEVLQQPDPGNLHYSSFATMNKKEAEEFKELMRSFVRDLRDYVTKTHDEQVFSYSLDFYKISE